jgi:hypothetical protein
MLGNYVGALTLLRGATTVTLGDTLMRVLPHREAAGQPCYADSSRRTFASGTRHHPVQTVRIPAQVCRESAATASTLWMRERQLLS